METKKSHRRNIEVALLAGMLLIAPFFSQTAEAQRREMTMEEHDQMVQGRIGAGRRRLTPDQLLRMPLDRVPPNQRREAEQLQQMDARAQAEQQKQQEAQRQRQIQQQQQQEAQRFAQQMEQQRRQQIQQMEQQRQQQIQRQQQQQQQIQRQANDSWDPRNWGR